jgi:hypothetical protein
MKLSKSNFIVLILILTLIGLAPLSLSSFGFVTIAQSSETRRLEDNIASLKDKIKNSTSKDPKDIQKLYKLENELQKKIYLKQNSK